MLPRADMEALQRVYEAGIASLTDVAAQFHLTSVELRQLARRYGWRRYTRPSAQQPAKSRAGAKGYETVADPPAKRKLRETEPKEGDGGGQDRPEVAATAKAAPPGKLVIRLRRLVERLIAAVEAQPLDAMDDPERWGKALTTITKCAQAIDELERPALARASPAPGVAPGAPTPSSLDELRKTLDRRLDELLAAHRADTVSGEPE